LVEVDGLIFSDCQFQNLDFKDLKFSKAYPVKINDCANIIAVEELKNK
jgi:hypothetical protein